MRTIILLFAHTSLHDCIRNLPFWLKLELEPRMAIFQSQGEGLYEQEKVPALALNSRSWTCYSGFASDLKRDWISFIRYQEDRRFELDLAGVPEEDWPPCWSYDRDWLPADAEWHIWTAPR